MEHDCKKILFHNTILLNQRFFIQQSTLSIINSNSFPFGEGYIIAIMIIVTTIPHFQKNRVFGLCKKLLKSHRIKKHRKNH